MNFSTSFSLSRALFVAMVALVLFATLVEGSGYGLARGKRHMSGDVLKRHSTHIHVHHKGRPAAPLTPQTPTAKKRKPLKRKLPPVVKRDEPEETCTVDSSTAAATSTASASTHASSQTPASGTVPQNVATSAASNLQIPSIWPLTLCAVTLLTSWIIL